MEAIETTPDVLRRILDALDLYARGRPPGTEIDPDEQIEVVVRAAEGRDLAFRGQDSLVPEKRHIVHCGRRVGTLTRNGGQWVFRFATSMTDDVVHAVADRLSSLVGELEESRIADLGSHQHSEEGRSRKSGGGSQGSNMRLSKLPRLEARRAGARRSPGGDIDGLKSSRPTQELCANLGDEALRPNFAAILA